MSEVTSLEFHMRHLGKKNLLEGQGSTASGYQEGCEMSLEIFNFWLDKARDDFSSVGYSPIACRNWPGWTLLTTPSTSTSVLEVEMLWLLKTATVTRAVYKDNLPGELVSLDLSVFQNCSISHQHPMIRRDDDEAGHFSYVVDTVQRSVSQTRASFSELILVLQGVAPTFTLDCLQIT